MDAKRPAIRVPGNLRRVALATRIRNDHAFLLMALPAVLLMLVFIYIPLIGNVIAFMDYVPFIPIQESPWVGLKNFERMFGDPAFWRAAINTLEITSLNLALYFPVPVLLAVLLHSLMRPWLRTVAQSILYLPHFLSWVIVVGLFQQMLGGGGAVNRLIISLNLDPVNFLGNPDTFKLLITSQVIWKDAGWGTIIFLAALTAIDENLYEAAAIDGADGWRRFWHVTLPGLRPIIILLLILRLGDALNVGFEQILLQRDAVGPRAAEVLDTYVYFHGVIDQDWSVGIAAGLLKGIIGTLLILGANKVAHLLGEAGVYQKS